MASIAVQELLDLERVASGAAIIEVSLSESPSHQWARRFEEQAGDPPADVIYDVTLHRHRPSVVLRTLPPLDEDRERAALEWLHGVVAQANAAAEG